MQCLFDHDVRRLTRIPDIDCWGAEGHGISENHCLAASQLAKMKKSIPDMSLP